MNAPSSGAAARALVVMRSEAESEAQREVLQILVCATTREAIVRLHLSARYLPDFADDLDQREVERRIEEVRRAVHLLRRVGYRGRGGGKADKIRADRRGDVGRLVVLVLT